MIGQKFGRWTVLEEGEATRPPCGDRKRRMLCECECGTVKLVQMTSLRSGGSRSCGCLQREVARERRYREALRTRRMQIILDGFLGWTTEHLNFIPVGDTYALVDGEDYPKLRPTTWYLQRNNSNTYYARTGGTNIVLMHRAVLPLPKGFEVDHKNRNGLDNRRENLRPATTSQNQANKRTQKTNKSHSRYKGVTSHRNGWEAKIGINYKTKHLGIFPTEQEAATAYNEAAIKHFGQFARVNQI